MSICEFTAIFPARKFDRQKDNEKKNENHHFTKHRNKQNINVDGTDYTIQTAATR